MVTLPFPVIIGEGMHEAAVLLQKVQHWTVRIYYWRMHIADQNRKPVPAAVVECEVRQPNGIVLATEKALSGSDETAFYSRSLSRGAAPRVYTVRIRTIAHSDFPKTTYTPGANLKSVAMFEIR